MGRIEAVEHVHLEATRSFADALIDFYAGLAGLEQVDYESWLSGFDGAVSPPVWAASHGSGAASSVPASVANADAVTPVEGLVFKSSRIRLWVGFVEVPRVDAARRRMTVRVADLDELASTLGDLGMEFRLEQGSAITDRRLAVRDPVGHLIEFRQLWPMV